MVETTNGTYDVLQPRSYGTPCCLHGKLGDVVQKVAGWTCGQQEKELILLFLQRARELLLHTTPCSAKTFHASVFLLAKELTFLSTQEKKTPHSSTQKQINYILEEITKALKIDEIARQFIGDRISHLTNILKGENGIDEKIEAASLLRRRITRGDYLTEANNRIVDIIKTKPNERERLLNLTECAISAIIDAGYPAQTIYHLLNVTFLNKLPDQQVTGPNSIDKFFSYFDLAKHEYTVFFSVANPPEKLEQYFPESRYRVLRLGEQSTTDVISAWPQKSRDFFFGTKNVKAIIQRIKIEALDPQSARFSAEQSLSLHADVLRASVHKYSLPLENEAIVYRRAKDDYVQSNRPRPPVLRHPKDAAISTTDFTQFFSKINRIEKESINRYVRAIQLHSNALDAKEVESQLLSIWIAFETLFVRGTGRSKIEEVAESITPYLLYHSIVETTADLWKYIKSHHGEIWHQCTADLADLNDAMDEVKLLALISIKTYEAQMTDFMGRLSLDPLLKHKLWQLIKRGQKAKTIENHVNEMVEKIAFDIARIYRMRNQIVHVGYTAGELGEIVQRAHHFLDVVLNTIRSMIGVSGGAFSLEQATMEVKITTETYRNRLRNEASSNAECTLSNFTDLHWGRELLA